MMDKKQVFEKFVLGASAWSGLALSVFALSIAYASLSYVTPMAQSSVWTTISSSEWNKIVGNIETLDTQLSAVSATATAASNAVAGTVPSGAVMAFNLASCPTGWKPANGTNSTPDLRWEFIRGLDSGRWVDSGRSLWSAQNGSYVPLWNAGSLIWMHWLDDAAGTQSYWWANSSVVTGGWTNAFDSSWWTASAGFSQAWAGWAAAGVTNFQYAKVRPRNVALLYCVKN